MKMNTKNYAGGILATLAITFSTNAAPPLVAPAPTKASGAVPTVAAAASGGQTATATAIAAPSGINAQGTTTTPLVVVPAATTPLIVGQTTSFTNGTNFVPPVGGVMVPGGVGGQLTPGAPGGQLTSGAVGGTLSPAGFPRLPALGVTVSNAATLPNYRVTSPNVIVIGGTYAAPGGVLTTTGIGGTRSAVIVTGGSTVTRAPGGAFTNNGQAAGPNTVIVTGGQNVTAQPRPGVIVINH